MVIGSLVHPTRLGEFVWLVPLLGTIYTPNSIIWGHLPISTTEVTIESEEELYIVSDLRVDSHLIRDIITLLRVACVHSPYLLNLDRSSEN
jgi:hypothetical protein